MISVHQYNNITVYGEVIVVVKEELVRGCEGGFLLCGVSM